MRIRELPEQHDRVETGPTRFGNDWPGVFIRGDNALYLHSILQGQITKDWDWIAVSALGELVEILGSCDIKKHAPPAPNLDGDGWQQRGE